MWRRHTVQYSDDLVHWWALTNLPPMLPRYEVIDTGLAGSSARFYRVLTD